MTIRLNVGGVIYMTTESTLNSKEWMLSNIQSNKIPLDKDETGAFFIDRDGTCFGEILNYLRDGSVIPPESVFKCKRMALEANYYCLNELTEALLDHIKTDELMSVGNFVPSDDRSNVNIQKERALGVPVKITIPCNINKLNLQINSYRPSDMNVEGMIAIEQSNGVTQSVGKTIPVNCLGVESEILSLPFESPVRLEPGNYFLAITSSGMLSLPCYPVPPGLSYAEITNGEIPQRFSTKSIGIVAVGLQKRQPNPKYDDILNRTFFDNKFEHSSR